MSKADVQMPLSQDFGEFHQGQQHGSYQSHSHSGYISQLHQTSSQANSVNVCQAQNQPFSFAHLQNVNNYNQPQNLLKNVVTSHVNNHHMSQKLMNGSLTTKRSLNDYINNRADTILQKNQAGGVQLANAIAQKDKLVKLANTGEQQYQIYKKNFPYMSEQEIQDLVKQDLNEEESSQMLNGSGEKNQALSQIKQIERITNINKNLTQFKVIKLIQPHFQNQSQQFEQKISNIKVQNPINMSNIPKVSKKRNRQAVYEEEEAQHQQMIDESLNVSPQSQKQEDSDEFNSQKTEMAETQNHEEQQEISLQQINVEVPHLKDEQINSCNNGSDQQSFNAPQQQDAAKDQFFNQMSNNLNNYLHDKGEAYKFIINQLNIYDQNQFGQSVESSNPELEQENQELKKKLKQITRDEKILKNGIRLQNRKIGENEQKCKHYDQIFSSNQKMSSENTMLKTWIHSHLKSQIGDPHMKTNFGGPSTDYGGSSGFGGGSCGI